MRQLQWGDELCGAKVTPESWVVAPTHNSKGIVEMVARHKYHTLGAVIGGWLRARAWEPSDKYEGGTFQTSLSHMTQVCCTRPIFPPRGFAGKTDAELWEALTRRGPYARWSAVLSYGYDPTRGIVSICQDGQIQLLAHDCSVDHDCTTLDPTALILTLRNAMVLAKRLEVK